MRSWLAPRCGQFRAARSRRLRHLSLDSSSACRSLGFRSGDEPHGSRAVGLHDPLLCCRVHGVAETGHVLEHRHRRCCRRAATRNRVGCGDRTNRGRAACAFPHYLPLDADATISRGTERLRFSFVINCYHCDDDNAFV